MALARASLRGFGRKLWTKYTHCLEQRPIATQAGTSALLWGAGDIAAQLIEDKLKDRPHGNSAVGASCTSHTGHTSEDAIISSSSSGSSGSSSVSCRRTAVQAAFAALVWAPAAHHWYLALDRCVGSFMQSGTRRFVAAKLGLEFTVLHPIFLTAFFSIVGLANGQSVDEIQAQLQHDFWPSLAIEWSFWLPVDVALFSFVPARHQLLMINCGCFVESIVLSFIKENGISWVGVEQWLRVETLAGAIPAPA